MPRKKKVAVATEAALPQIPSDWLDQVVTGLMTQEAVERVMMGFKKAVIERALGAEMSHHLGYPPGAVKPEQRTRRHRTTGCWRIRASLWAIWGACGAVELDNRLESCLRLSQAHAGRNRTISVASITS